MKANKISRVITAIVIVCISITTGLAQTAKDYEARASMNEYHQNYEAAISLYQQALKLSPGNAEYISHIVFNYTQVGKAFIADKQYGKGIAQYNLAIATNAKDVRGHYYKGMAYMEQEKFKEAIDAFTDAVPCTAPKYDMFGSQAINRKTILQQRAIAYFKIGDFTNSIADATQLIQVDKEDYRSYEMRGSMYAQQNKLDLAIADFTASLQLDRKNKLTAYLGRSTLYHLQKKFDLALADATTAIETYPNQANLYGFRAAIYCTSGNKKLAAIDENKTIELGGRLAKRCE